MLQKRLDGTLAACQFGITMPSLALEWVGEPAVARIIEPVVGMLTDSEALLHGVSFVIAFSAITAAHLVAGEQVPEIFTISRPEQIALRCAPLMKTFYHLVYPFLWALNRSTSAILSRLASSKRRVMKARTQKTKSVAYGSVPYRGRALGNGTSIAERSR